ncbi:DinB family protein [Hymenobacter sp.]|jgi:hypothetical protein|uniref:DinB family protein n=1 Tax=Hymenobacter sp. TaxID=1898978 RepID=UPI002ED8466E
MALEAVVTDVRNTLVGTFSNIDRWWFEKDAHLRAYRPRNGGWTIDQILEHIGLTNHYLLILIEKGVNKALLNTQQANLASESASYRFPYAQLAEIGQHKSFAWIRPEHMEPTGAKPLVEVRQQLTAQVQQCLTSLDALRNGRACCIKQQ